MSDPATSNDAVEPLALFLTRVPRAAYPCLLAPGDQVVLFGYDGELAALQDAEVVVIPAVGRPVRVPVGECRLIRTDVPLATTVIARLTRSVADIPPIAAPPRALRDRETDDGNSAEWLREAIGPITLRDLDEDLPDVVDPPSYTDDELPDGETRYVEGSVIVCYAPRRRPPYCPYLVPCRP